MNIMKRRDLLKFFAAGTVIAPVAGETITARLIEVPKVEPIQVATQLPRPLHLGDVDKVRIIFTRMDGTTETVNADVTWFRQGTYGNFVPGSEMEINMELLAAGQAGSPQVWTRKGELRAAGRLA